MALFPPLTIAWLNGWIPLVLFYGVFLILLKVFPQETVARLYDRSHWTSEQARTAKIGLSFGLAAIALIIFTSLKIGQHVFWIGLILYIVGFAGFVYSLHTYNITPLGKPATRGLYKISRNPQWVTFAVTFLGIIFMMGSWTMFVLLLIRMITNHFRLIGEEGALELQYGESYLDYKKSVPRYFGFF